MLSVLTTIKYKINAYKNSETKKANTKHSWEVA